MMGSKLEPSSRLHGRSIFLSASVPTIERRDEYERIPEAPIQIEEAVMCVARAIFIEGGTLVFGAHPSISPLLARVIQHYYVPPPAEATDRERPDKADDTNWKNPRLLMYQSDVWSNYWAESSKRLTEHPLVRSEEQRLNSSHANISYA